MLQNFSFHFKLLKSNQTENFMTYYKFKKKIKGKTQFILASHRVVKIFLKKRTFIVYSELFLNVEIVV